MKRILLVSLMALLIIFAGISKSSKANDCVGTNPPDWECPGGWTFEGCVWEGEFQYEDWYCNHYSMTARRPCN